MIKKILGLIKRHIVLFILSVIAFIALIIMIVAFLKMTINNSGKYGDRLDGIDKVKISKSTLSDISDKIKENTEVEKSNVRVQGKIVYIDITFNGETSLDRAKEIATVVLDEFDDDEKGFYDIEFILEQNAEEGWRSAGSKTPSSEGISWIKN